MSSASERTLHIVESAKKLFSQPVLEIEAPGGESRASYRLIFADQTVIATLRPNYRRTHIEAFILQELGALCEDLPKCLGVDGRVLFQSDVGDRRLNLEINTADPDRRINLAQEAVASIFRIQSAGRSVNLQNTLPHLGQNKKWLMGLVDGCDALQEFSSYQSANVEREAVLEKLAYPGRQFVKWDCRSGNAAIGTDDKLRWFDCEYAGARHGAEDFAWLIGDEAWPLSPDEMVTIITDCFDKSCGHDLEAYLDYLGLYVTFHSLQRFKLIIREVRKNGWKSKAHVRKFDGVGVHPEFAAQICKVGSYFAARNRITSHISRDFEEAEGVFLALSNSNPRRASA